MDFCQKHFMKHMSGVFRQSITMPDQLTTQFEDLIDKLLELKRPGGTTWHVGLIKSGEKLTLKPGWNDFVTENNLQENDTVVFKYIGASEFEVLIFNLHGCEKSVLGLDSETSQPLTPVMPLTVCASNLGKRKEKNNIDAYYKPNFLKPTHLDRLGTMKDRMAKCVSSVRSSSQIPETDDDTSQESNSPASGSCSNDEPSSQTQPPRRRGRGPNQLTPIPVDPSNKIIIRCYGDRMLTGDRDTVHPKITSDLCNIAKNINKDCTKFSDWTEEDKLALRQEFLRRYQWALGQNEANCIRAFESCASDRFRNGVYDARRKASNKLGLNVADWISTKENIQISKPWWATESQWIEMCHTWNTDTFKEQSRRNKMNRASGSEKGRYYGGSKSRCDHMKEKGKKLNRDGSYMEVSKRMKTKKSVGAYVGKKLAAIEVNSDTNQDDET